VKLEKAKETVANLKSALVDPYWGHVYHLLQNELLPKEDWEYDVYVEYNRDFNLEQVGKLINLLGGLTYTLAIPTRQIIVW